ncbi:MAG: hypothetical protein BJ554DRAFT_6586, partial [Olpidium bornovanus]
MGEGRGEKEVRWGPTSTKVGFIVVNGNELRTVDLASGPVQAGRLLEPLPPLELLGSLRFDSKVVSRTHAKVFMQDGKLYIQDTKSSSGTFLNGQRLSNMGQESGPRELRDGDIVVLGEDYNLDGGQSVLSAGPDFFNADHKAIILKTVIPHAPEPKQFQWRLTEAGGADDTVSPTDGFGAVGNADVQAGIETDFEQVWRSITQDIPRPLDRLRQMLLLLPSAQENGKPRAQPTVAEGPTVCRDEGSAAAGHTQRAGTLIGKPPFVNRLADAPPLPNTASDDGAAESSQASEGQLASPKAAGRNLASPRPATPPVPRIATPPVESASGAIRPRDFRERHHASPTPTSQPASPDASSQRPAPDASPQHAPPLLRGFSGCTLPPVNPSSPSRVLASARAIEKALNEGDPPRLLNPTARPHKQISEAGAGESVVASYIQSLSTFPSSKIQARLVKLAQEGDKDVMALYG